MMKMQHDEWFKLPLSLRQRWWTETDYGKKEPSDDLVREIKKLAPPTVIILCEEGSAP
jgi:hypothetical protein